MLTTNEKKPLLKALLACSCSAIILLTALAADVTAGSCLYSEQLASDPALKAAFTVELAAARNEPTTGADDDLYYSDIETGIHFDRNSAAIDMLSIGCLSCHDGVTAPDFKVRIKNNPAGRVMSLVDIVGGHPIGMEYEKYVTAKGKEYRGSSTGEMVFADGKIGCLTCHNPLNSTKGHLVMNNDQSALCFSCHNK